MASLSIKYNITTLVLILTGITQAVSLPAFAAEVYDYPELSVTPRASDRLETEAKKEATGNWSAYLPIQLAAIANLGAASQQTSTTSSAAQIAGYAVGGAWMVTTVLLSAFYHPYASGMDELGLYPKKGTQREQLTRERVAEEAINHAASLENKIRWFAVGTNLVTAIYILSHNNNGVGYPSPTAQGLAEGTGLGAVLFALAPLAFRGHWQDVAEEQADYKKRIYAPVASATLFSEPLTGRPSPGISLSFNF